MDEDEKIIDLKEGADGSFVFDREVSAEKLKEERDKEDKKLKSKSRKVKDKPKKIHVNNKEFENTSDNKVLNFLEGFSKGVSILEKISRGF